MIRPADTRPKLLLVDDEPTNLQVLRQILQDDYRLLFAKDGDKALELAERENPALILLDVMMPGMTGHEVCARLKSQPATSTIPVIFVTALADVEDEARGFEVGAVDYITKPVSPPIVRARVRTHLSLVRAEELHETRLQIVQRLGLASEYKDNETGLHVIRMSHYTYVLAKAAGYSEREADDLLNAAPMHDVGKIGIPDAILQKNGKLDDAEWAVMRQHAQIGAEIIGEHDSGLLKTARIIALTHHEKWDGSGYPNGLKGEEIPLAGRIVAIADVFDALTSVRPYKAAWPVEEAISLLRRESGRHFDPELVELFIGQMPAILEIKERWAEKE
ncbi:MULTISPECIES: two-component system response regulator [unclassified Pseudomonas]|uniref:two-component system response regulator n=1 Tax=unclassified Pseudomonas TaxID=196821 RepID=UPI002448BBE9|nr:MULTISPECIES: two-component system response regulator [unclassified Pseudomonas]MDG9927376.1 two-component system response regulator [Pseudomonas sp. GD04042]MDH0482445.1 two-component system response regulator [Pseudomonas sp. GD04015]MDH0602797.1 two-component system response regulator [Pseudomonas sp. GD03869]